MWKWIKESLELIILTIVVSFAGYLMVSFLNYLANYQHIMIYFLPIVVLITYLLNYLKVDHKGITHTLTTMASYTSGGFVGKIGYFTTLVNSSKLTLVKKYRLPLLTSLITTCLHLPLTAAMMVIEFNPKLSIKEFIFIIISMLVTSFNLHLLNVPILKAYQPMMSFNIANILKVLLLISLLLLTVVFLKLNFTYHKYHDEKPLFLIINGILLMFLLIYFKGYQLLNIESINKYSPLMLVLFFLLTNLCKLKGGVVAPSLLIGASLGHFINPSLWFLGMLGMLSANLNYRFAPIVLGIELFGIDNLIVYIIMILVIEKIKGWLLNETIIENVCQKLPKL